MGCTGKMRIPSDAADRVPSCFRLFATRIDPPKIVMKVDS